MRLLIGKEPLSGLLKWSRRALLACGVLLLGYCGFALVDAWLFQRRQSAALDRLLRDRPAAASEGAPQPASFTSPKVAPAAEDGLVGRIEIPRLLLSVVVAEGIGRATLRRGVGHIPGTALPGAAGNIGLAGHRDTFFRPLKDLKVKDEVRLSTLKGIFNYEVVSLRIVDPDDVGVLAPLDENVLTLVTCYPFNFVGPAPKRWIVTARQVSSQTAPPPNVK